MIVLVTKTDAYQRIERRLYRAGLMIPQRVELTSCNEWAELSAPQG